MKGAITRIHPAELESWLRFFRSRRDRDAGLPWRDEGPIAPEARRRIAASIATFQLGESSDGRHLIAAARGFARAQALPPIEEITGLFVREEQFHASLLAAFMHANGIERRHASWSDTVFRSLRRLGGFEAAISVLIVAELIALTYYRALGAATPSRVLRGICELIVADERAHVSYEGMLINRLRGRRPGFGRLATLSAHSILFAGAVLVVYAGHRQVLRAGGYGLPRFWASCWSSFTDFVAREPAPPAYMGGPPKGAWRGVESAGRCSTNPRAAGGPPPRPSKRP